MKTFPFVLIAIVSGLLCCRTEDDPNPETKPQTADLYDFKLEVGGSVFETQIQDNEIVLKRLLPFNTKKVRVNLISTSENTIVNIEVGDSLAVRTESVAISVKHTVSKRENEYSLRLGTGP